MSGKDKAETKRAGLSNPPNPNNTPSKSKSRRSSSPSEVDLSPSEKADNKKSKSVNRIAGQRTLDSFAKGKPSPCTKSEFEILCAKMEDMKLTLQNVVKISDLDEKLKFLVTKDELKECVSKETKKLQEDNEKMRSQLFEVQRENDALKLRMQNLECAVQINVQNTDMASYKADKARDQINDLEQHGRANSIRIYGINDIDKYEDAETSIKRSVEFLNNMLELDLHPKDVDVAHRLGPFVANQRRGIIVKFTRRVNKMKVLQNKKKLENTEWSIKEDITNAVRAQMHKIRTNEDIPVWSQNGKIFAQKQGRVVKYDSELKCRIQNFEKKLENNRNK